MHPPQDASSAGMNARPIPRRQRRLCTAMWLCVGLITTPVAIAEVVLPNVFSDHMVLQRRQPNKVWGKAAPGENVSVTIGTQAHAAT
ncbi:MAG: hypothetical protein M3Z20_17565, partial [Chloroflexota bacterium]|nr:hypothetical protein [Chloroflexota bacterium]